MAKTHEMQSDELSTKVRKAVDDVRRPFGDFVRGFASLETKRRDLAPKFMKAANLWQAETGKSFVEFVRLLVPDVGDTVKEYKAHPAYQSADYLRRLVGRAALTSQGGNATGDQQGERPQSPMVVLERLIKAFAEKMPDSQLPKLFDIIKEECNWPQDRIDTLADRIDQVDPLVSIRGRTLDAIRIEAPIHTQEEVAA